MRAYLPDYRVVNPRTTAEALEALASGEDVRPLAGGTDIMVYMQSGEYEPCTLVNLYGIEDTEDIDPTEEGVRLGPLFTYRQARTDERLRDSYPMLGRAAREISVLALQSRATWAGNIVNASPAADGVPALMAYDAELELSSTRGSRRVRLDRFYQGYKRMDRRSDELLTAIHLPQPHTGRSEYYNKVGTRRFQAITKTLLAGWLDVSEDGVVRDVRMCLASVAPHTLRARETESVLREHPLTPDRIERACEAIQEEISPIDDIRSTETYRRRVTRNLVRDFLEPHGKGS